MSSLQASPHKISHFAHKIPKTIALTTLRNVVITCRTANFCCSPRYSISEVAYDVHLAPLIGIAIGFYRLCRNV